MTGDHNPWPKLAQRWLGARLKRSRRPWASVRCPECGSDDLRPQWRDSLRVACHVCDWSCRLDDLEGPM